MCSGETPIPREKVRNRIRRMCPRTGARETLAPKNGKNGAALLAEELQMEHAKRRMARGLCRQKEEISQRRVLRALQEPHGKR